MQKHRIYSVVTYFCREVEKINIILLCFYSVSDANEAASSLCMCFSYKRDIFHCFFFLSIYFFSSQDGQQTAAVPLPDIIFPAFIYSGLRCIVMLF